MPDLRHRPGATTAESSSRDGPVPDRTTERRGGGKALGLVTWIIAPGRPMDQERKMAKTIASMLRPIAMLTRQAVNRSPTRSGGICIERRTFRSPLAIEDQNEGMTAFVEIKNW